MRTWARHSTRRACGRCGRVFNEGEARQIVTPDASRSVTQQIVRCQKCAEGEPPADLPALASRQIAIEPSPMVRVAAMKAPVDFKQAAAGREPGEDE